MDLQRQVYHGPRGGLAAALAFLFFALVTYTSDAVATPLLALKEAANCGGCHNPGRSQRPVLQRRCTLDCQGCHVDPAGGGPRNQWGYYYENDQLAAVNFFKPIDPLADQSRFDLHYDGRVMQRSADGKTRTFPMSSEASARVRPFVTYMHFVYQAQFLGRIDDAKLRADTDDPRRLEQKYAVMIDQLPMNLYVRAYRGAPMYGLRRPNHALWIRERTGLDQYALTEAVEAGGTPNVPFLRASLMRGDPRAPEEERQRGTSFHGGFRGVTLGWHLNGSTWDTRSDRTRIKMRALGAGLSPWKFVVMGERNWREVEELEATSEAAAGFAYPGSGVHPSSQIDEWTLAFTGIPGVNFGGVQEELHDSSHDSLRRSAFVDLHPVPNVALELWRRFESGTRQAADTLGVLHVYADW